MRARVVFTMVAVGFLAVLTPTRAGDLPDDAAKRVKEFEAEAEAIQKKADAEIKARRDKLIDDLQKMAKAYTESSELRAATAIREWIKKLNAVVDPKRNLIVNGSFEEGPDTAGRFATLEKGSNAIKGWVVSQGNLDFIDAAFWQCADGKRSLDMNGAMAGGISQTFKTKKGQKYRVTFSLAGNPYGDQGEKKLQVSAAGKKTEFTFDTTGKSAEDMGWVSKTWDFVADADEATLEFLSLIDGDSGPALDNVAVVWIGE